MGASDENQGTSSRKPARAHSALARTDLGLRIRELRRERGLSQRKAAGALISPSFMSRLESGDRNVGVTVLQALTVTMPDVRFVIEAGELRVEVLPKS
ncbi:MAG TPA: helix-turn-helix transcriptional regulator [Gaiellaceae bacterium]|nr:helix-turn-helix transcriptional regulator [Gaiellaceae bacterium]